MKKKLTRRQQSFLHQFLEIYREAKQPVHYGFVAEHLGIGKVSAYEMLRLLEERGFVGTEYQANPTLRGPGRPAIFFYPAVQAFKFVNAAAGDAEEIKAWSHLKEQILQQLRERKSSGYTELLNDILARIPERYSPLIFITDLITAVILMLTSIQDTPEIRMILERLKQIGLPNKISLGVMSGIAMLLSVMERVNRNYATAIFTHFNRYEETLLLLSQESKRRLGEFTREAVQILSS